MKKFLSIFLSAVLMIVSCLVAGIFSLGPVLAETTTSTEPPIQDGKQVITNHYADNVNFSKSLYAVLSRIYTESGNTLGQGGSFPIDAFNSYTSLDLTLGQGLLADYPVDNKITSLVGMEYLSLNSLTTLTIDGHNITTIYSDDLSAMNKLQTLYITDSNVESISFPATMTQLTYLDLSGNKLTEVDVSILANKGTNINGRPYCNLSKNSFENAAKIKLPTTYPLRGLDVSYNNLVGAVASDFNANKVSILLQSYAPDAELVYGQKIYVADGFVRSDIGGEAQYEDITNLNAKIFFNTTSQYYATMPEAIAETVDGYVTVPCGKLVVKFFEGQQEITTVEDLSATSKDILPPAPTLKGYADGKELVNLSSSSNITVKAELALTGTSLDPFIKENCVVQIKVGVNGNYETLSSIDFTKGGRYSISTIISFDGLSSRVESTSVQKNDYTGLTWALIILVFIIVVAASLVYLLRWVREGAVVAPLTDNETRKIYKKMGRDYYVSDHRDLLEDGNNNAGANESSNSSYNNNDDDEVIGL